jgi:hypothetical protein
MTVVQRKFKQSKFYIGVASEGRLEGAYFISRGGKRWMRLKNKRCHFWQHALSSTNGEVAKLEKGEYATFTTSCTACHRECYEESVLEFISTDRLYRVTE